MAWRQALYPRLTQEAASLLRALADGDAAAIQEIRFRAGRETELFSASGSAWRDFAPTQAELSELVAALCGYSRYAFERQMAQGYIPLPGGHRAGVCGTIVEEEGVPARMSAITSVCIRIARRVPGASRPIRAQLVGENGLARRVLLLGAPGTGKTTLLRDAALWLSDERGLHVAAADERGELFPPEEAPGRRMDVLRGAAKPEAVTMLLRAMSPQVIVTDEIGGERDVRALLEAARCGVGLLASAHADGMESALLRPALRMLFDARAFDRYICLHGRGACSALFDALGKRIGGEEERG